MFRKTILQLSYIMFVMLFLFSCSKVQNQNIAEQVLTALAQPEWNGRSVGSEGNKAACDYLAELLGGLGYLPFNGDSLKIAYEQAFIPDTEAATEFIITYADGTSEILRPGVDYSFNAGVSAFQAFGTIAIEPGVQTLNGQIALYKEQPQYDSRLEGSEVYLILNDRLSFATNGYSLSKPYSVSITKGAYDKLTAGEAVAIEINYAPNHTSGMADNVIGLIPGADRSKALVISAHFDGTPSFGEAKLTSAYDNGSGCAALMYTAELLAAHYKETSPAQDIIVCFFNGEEIHSSGSKAVSGELEARYNELAVINIDCVGGRGAGFLAMTPFNEQSRQLTETIITLLDKEGIQYDDNADYGASDHSSFHNSSVVVLGQSGVFTLAHTADDKIENVSIKEIEAIAEVVAGFVVKYGVEELHGEPYLPEHGEKSADNIEYNTIDIKLVSAEAERLMTDMELAYDEMFIFEFKHGDSSLAFFKSGWYPLSTAEEFSLWYPDRDLNPLLSLSVMQGYSLFKVLENGSYSISDCSIYFGSERGLIKRPDEAIQGFLFYFSDDNRIITLQICNTPFDDNIVKPLSDMPGCYAYCDNESDMAWGLGYFDDVKKEYIYILYFDLLSGNNLLETEEQVYDFAQSFNLEENAELLFSSLLRAN